MHRLLSILALLVSLLAPSLASAQFNQHYSETIFLLNQSGAQPAITYLPIPRTGWPVHVQLSAVDPSVVSVQAVTEFIIVDSGSGNPFMTLPSQVAGGTAVTCQDNGPDAVFDCAVSASVSVGYTDTGTSSQPHRMFVKLSNCNCIWQFRITMWY